MNSTIIKRKTCSTFNDPITGRNVLFGRVVLAKTIPKWIDNNSLRLFHVTTVALFDDTKFECEFSSHITVSQ